MNNEILGALKSAVSRGHSIQNAMQTLLNAGYNRTEIEEAARSLQSGQTYAPQNERPKTNSPNPNTNKKTPSQKISNYEKPKQGFIDKLFKSKAFITTLIIAFVALVGLLVSVIIFKEQIVEMLSGFLG
jgi:hypothetical protein